MDHSPKLTTAQIGKCGELLVQLQLLRSGVESAPLTTDSGVDLVAYSPFLERPISIQVKTNQQAKPSGGKGRLGLDWWVPEDCPAQLVALVDLSSDLIWVFSMEQIKNLAQQNPSGRYHLYMYLDSSDSPKKNTRLLFSQEFAPYLLRSRIHELFGVPA
ncbi:hypothetical protein [Geothrix fuzhouensis]|uniref:hypothetical protein n=1 Tax=Geothrix fuzhouensis TaxID=2966451 RepID=UPI002147A1DB|nr:hypothetical protein [Geothrix fuzhouensis]